MYIEKISMLSMRYVKTKRLWEQAFGEVKQTDDMGTNMLT